MPLMEVESNSLVPYDVIRFISAVAHGKGGVSYFEPAERANPADISVESDSPIATRTRAALHRSP
jgi:hypothetical protein